MNRQYLSIAIMAVSAISLSACSPNYEAIKASPTATSAPVVKHDSQKNAHADTSVHTKAKAHHPAWSYAGNTGPEFWGDIKGATACKIGQEQSPINITQVTASSAAAPAITYSQSANVSIKNNGHTIVYTPTTHDNAISLGGERYELKQFHYHIPSEHQLAGKNYPGEMHFVHANSAGNLAVIGVMLQSGPANDVLRILLNGTQLTVENDVEFTANKVNLKALIPTSPTFYHYKGSLTTPPCSEQVQWYVTKQPLSLASDQFAIMYDLYDGNNRPVQPQGNRTVEQLSH